METEFCVDCGAVLTAEDREFTEGGDDCERCRKDDWALQAAIEQGVAGR